MSRARLFPVAALAATAIVVSLAHAQQTTADPRTWPQYIDGVAHMGPFAWRPGAEAVRNLAGAVAGGQVKAGPLAICRARHQGAVHPGKLWDRKCLIGFGGQEVAATDFDVLMRSADPKYAPLQQYFPTDRWVAPNAPEARAAFVGGQAGAQGLRVCRVKLQDGLHPGKEFGGKCNVGWGGKEMAVAAYQVLVLPNLMPQAAPATTAAVPQQPSAQAARATPPTAKQPEKQKQETAGADPKTWPAYIDGVTSIEPYAWVNGAEALKAGLAGAVAGGTAGGKPLMLCRARHQNAVHPGKLWGDKCYIGFGGQEVAAGDFDVLFRAPPKRHEASFPSDSWRLPANIDPRVTFYAGSDGKQPLRACRVRLPDGYHPGKEFAGKCNVGWGGKEHALAPYEILVLPNLAAGGVVPPASAQLAAVDPTKPSGPTVTTQTVTVEKKTIPTQPKTQTIQIEKSDKVTLSGLTPSGKLTTTQQTEVKLPPLQLTTFTYAAKPTKSAPICGGKGQQACPFVHAIYEGAAGSVCPKGQFPDLEQCWSCPENYDRTAAAVNTQWACAKRTGQAGIDTTKATYVGRLCPAGSFHDTIRGGECWKCPAGYEKAVLPHVEASNKCFQAARTDYSAATLHDRSNGLNCPAGQFHAYKLGWKSGWCYSCPANYVMMVLEDVEGNKKCAHNIAEKTSKATLVGKGVCEAGTFHDSRNGGECWKCPDPYAMQVLPAVTADDKCSKLRGLDYARATSHGQFVCEFGHHFDFINITAAEITAMYADEKKDESEITRIRPTNAEPVSSRTCWSCPTGYVRTDASVKTDKACRPETIVWRSEPYKEPGLFGIAGAEAVVVELLRDYPDAVNAAIEAYAEATGLDVEATRGLFWQHIRNEPQNSGILKTLLFDSIVTAIEAPAEATEAEKALLAGFGKYMQARRTFIAEDALQAYDQWKLGVDNSQTRQTSLTTLFHVAKPPDWYATVHEGVIAGMLLGPVTVATELGITMGNPEIRGKIMPSYRAKRKLAYRTAKVAKKGIGEIADLKSLEITKGTGKYAKKAGFNAKSLAKVSSKFAQRLSKLPAAVVAKITTQTITKLVFLAGPQIIVGVAVEVAMQAGEAAIEAQIARPKILVELASAKQPVDFTRMSQTEDGASQIDAYWKMAMMGSATPSPQAAESIRALVEQHFASKVAKLSVPTMPAYLKPATPSPGLRVESSSTAGLCLALKDGAVTFQSCADNTTAWEYNAKAALRNLDQNHCLTATSTGLYKLKKWTGATGSTCAELPTQKWSLQSDGTIKHVGSGNCLGQAAAATAGAGIGLTACSAAHKFKPKT